MFLSVSVLLQAVAAPIAPEFEPAQAPINLCCLRSKNCQKQRASVANRSSKLINFCVANMSAPAPFTADQLLAIKVVSTVSAVISSLGSLFILVAPAVVRRRDPTVRVSFRCLLELIAHVSARHTAAKELRADSGQPRTSLKSNHNHCMCSGCAGVRGPIGSAAQRADGVHVSDTKRRKRLLLCAGTHVALTSIACLFVHRGVWCAAGCVDSIRRRFANVFHLLSRAGAVPCDIGAYLIWCLLAFSFSVLLHSGNTHTTMQHYDGAASTRCRTLSYYAVGWGSSLVIAVVVAFISGYGRGALGVPVRYI